MKSFFFLFFLLWIPSMISAFPPPFPNPWEPFLNLSGCNLGDSRPGLSNLKNYLHRFGYIADPVSATFSDSFDADLQAAIQTYQRNFRLNVTGFLDSNTIDNIMLPRCGVADVFNGSSSMISAYPRGRNLFAFFPGNPMWPSSKRSLTYAFTSTSSVAIDLSLLRTVFSRSFGRWSAATTLSFSEIDSVIDADITIGFYSGNHGDGEPFDGVLGILAHAFSPTDGRFHLDAAEQWVAEGDVMTASSGTAVDLESVVVHEIGHLLGLGHSSEDAAIMYPTIKTRMRKVELSTDDVQGIQMLYGSNPNYTGASPAATAQARDSNGGGRVVVEVVGWSRLIWTLSSVVAVYALLIS